MLSSPQQDPNTVIQQQTMLQPSGSSAIAPTGAPSPSAIAEWKSRYSPQPLATRPVAKMAIDWRVVVAIAASISTPVTVIGGAMVIGNSSGTASQERMIHHMMQERAMLMEQVQKPRNVCVALICPAPKEESSAPSVPTGTVVQQQPQQPLTEYRWQTETPQQSTVVMADGTVVNVPPVQPRGY